MTKKKQWIIDLAKLKWVVNEWKISRDEQFNNKTVVSD